MSPSDLPSRKVGAGVLAGALTALFVWALTLIGPQYVMPPEVSAALTVVLTFFVSYLTTSSPGMPGMTERQRRVLGRLLDEAPDPPTADQPFTGRG